MRCELALLAHDRVEERDLHERLSERERVALAAVARPEARRRRGAGRLAAKHLLLRGGGEGAAPARLVALDGARLLAFPAERYREVELMSDAGGGAPRPTLRGEPLGARLSIAHASDLSCAAMSPAGAAVGIDLEVVAPRSGAFYRGNFTARERAWIAVVADDGAVGSEWLFTFLWTVKEAALKSGAVAVRSVWDFPGAEVEPPAGLAGSLAASVGAELGERFAAVDVDVVAGGQRTRGRVETTATRELILSIFEPVTAAASEATP